MTEVIDPRGRLAQALLGYPDMQTGEEPMSEIEGTWNERSGVGRPVEPCGRPGGALRDPAPASGDASGLVDPFGRRITYLRFAITENCNLRCSYCRPAEESGVAGLPPVMSRSEVVRIGALFVRLGVRKIRLTGGEPTLHPGLLGIVEDLAALRPAAPVVALTTNGVLLSRLAGRLRKAGLSRVNVSLDAASAEGFRAITLRDRFDEVRAGIDAALAAGFESVKVNAVALRGVNDDEIPRLAELARENPVDVRFIEYMPIAGNDWSRSRHIPAAEIEERLGREIAFREVRKETDGGPARMLEAEGFRGRIGFISPLSLPFCNDCNRVRVTARGALRLCLLGGGEADLLGPVRSGESDDLLAGRIRLALAGKGERHEVRIDGEGAGPCGSPMWAVGG